MGALNFKEGIIHYYIFQKKLSNYLKINHEGEDKTMEGYFINPDWIEDWRNIINYNKIKHELDELNVDEKNFDKFQDYYFKDIDDIEEESIKIFLSNDFKMNQIDITQIKFFEESAIKNIIPKHIYKALQINDKNTKIEIKCIFKRCLFIFGIEEQHTFKIIITNAKPFFNNKQVINLSWKLVKNHLYYIYLNFFEKNNSDKIIEKFTSLKIFGCPSLKQTNSKTKELESILINENFGTEYNKGNNKKEAKKIIMKFSRIIKIIIIIKILRKKIDLMIILLLLKKKYLTIIYQIRI